MTTCWPLMPVPPDRPGRGPWWRCRSRSGEGPRPWRPRPARRRECQGCAAHLKPSCGLPCRGTASTLLVERYFRAGLVLLVEPDDLGVPIVSADLEERVDTGIVVDLELRLVLRRPAEP